VFQKLRNWVANLFVPYYKEALDALTESESRYQSMCLVACRIEEVRQAEVMVLAGIIAALSFETPTQLTISRELYELGKKCAVKFENLEGEPSRMAVVVVPHETEEN
jgi:hypothetical protein